MSSQAGDDLVVTGSIWSYQRDGVEHRTRHLPTRLLYSYVIQKGRLEHLRSMLSIVSLTLHDFKDSLLRVFPQ